MRFVPLSFLKKDLGEVDIEELVELLAYARYIQEIEAGIISKGIADVLGE